MPGALLRYSTSIPESSPITSFPVYSAMILAFISAFSEKSFPSSMISGASGYSAKEVMLSSNPFKSSLISLSLPLFFVATINSFINLLSFRQGYLPVSQIVLLYPSLPGQEGYQAGFLKMAHPLQSPALQQNCLFLP